MYFQKLNLKTLKLDRLFSTILQIEEFQIYKLAILKRVKKSLQNCEDMLSILKESNDESMILEASLLATFLNIF